MDPERISFLREDATVFMKDALSRNESWDIVILDPPKLAPRKKVKSRFGDRFYTFLLCHAGVFVHLLGLVKQKLNRLKSWEQNKTKRKQKQYMDQYEVKVWQ